MQINLLIFFCNFPEVPVGNVPKLTKAIRLTPAQMVFQKYLNKKECK